MKNETHEILKKLNTFHKFYEESRGCPYTTILCMINHAIYVLEDNPELHKAINDLWKAYQMFLENKYSSDPILDALYYVWYDYATRKDNKK